jgi:hypothetical protein
MAEAFAVVNVGKREWLFAKVTPCVRIQNIVGVSTALTEPARIPSKTTMTIFRGGCAAGFSCPLEKGDQEYNMKMPATIPNKCFFIQNPFYRE